MTDETDISKPDRPATVKTTRKPRTKKPALVLPEPQLDLVPAPPTAPAPLRGRRMRRGPLRPLHRQYSGRLLPRRMHAPIAYPGLLHSDDHAAHREDGLPYGESPVDIEPMEHGESTGLAWTSKFLAAGALLLAVFNTSAVHNWATQVPVNQYTAPLIGIADKWYYAAQSVGLTWPVETIRSGWKAVQGAQWGGEDDSNQEDAAPPQ